MAAIVMAAHQVQGYGAWREVLDGAAGIGPQYGHVGSGVLTAPGNESEVIVIAPVPVLEDARGFAGGSGLREAMSRSGVTANRMPGSSRRLS